MNSFPLTHDDTMAAEPKGQSVNVPVRSHTVRDGLPRSAALLTAVMGMGLLVTPVAIARETIPETVEILDTSPGAMAKAGQRRIRFVPPKNSPLPLTAETESRGSVRFAPPAERAPTHTAGAGSRGRIRFAPVGERAPENTAGAGSRGRVRFAPVGERAPENTAGAGSRGRVRFAPPGERAPVNTVGTGSRETTDPDALALLPPGSYTQTTSDRPTLMLYLPETGADRAFVSVKEVDGKFHHQTQVSLAEDNGIVEVPFPQDAPALEVGRDYLWQVILLAPGERLEPDTPALRITMARVEATPAVNAGGTDVLTPAIALDRAVDLAEAGLWIDTLQVLADARRSNPDNADLEKEWLDLLSQVGLGEVASAPLLSLDAMTESID